MDLGSLFKGATDTLKKLESDVANAGKDLVAMPSDGGSTNPKWAPTGDDGWEDDGWEDVADAGPTPPPSRPVVPTTAAPAPPPAPSAASSGAAGNKPTAVTAAAPDASATAALHAELDAAQKRAKTLELKLFAVTRERDTLRRSRDSRTADASLVKQKDEQIQAVLAEGEQLSIKIAEKEATVRSQRQRLADVEAALEEKTAACAAADAAAEAARTRERAADTAQRAATEAKDAAEKRLRTLEGASRANEQSSATVDKLRAELEAANRAAADAVRATEARLTTQHAIADARREAERTATEHALNKAIAELRARLVHDSDSAGAREDRLRREAATLRERASALEARNEELAAAVPHATRPLLRQIEALQAASAERARAAAAAERGLMARVRAAAAASAAAAEREKAAEEQAAELATRVAALQEQARIARARADAAEKDLGEARDEAAAEVATLRREVRAEKARAGKVAKERDELAATLSAERAAALDAADAAEARERALREKVAATETRLEAAREQMAVAPSTPRAPSSAAGSYAELVAPSPRPAGSPLFGHDADGFGALSESGSVPNGLYATERMASALRLKSGEVQSLQTRLAEKEEATKALAEEVVALTERLDAVTKEVADAPEVREKLKELEKRHEMLLVLLGEREERIGELDADLFDVKAMYKEQVNELLMRIEKMQS